MVAPCSRSGGFRGASRTHAAVLCLYLSDARRRHCHRPVSQRGRDGRDAPTVTSRVAVGRSAAHVTLYGWRRVWSVVLRPARGSGVFAAGWMVEVR